MAFKKSEHRGEGDTNVSNAVASPADAVQVPRLAFILNICSKQTLWLKILIRASHGHRSDAVATQ